MIKDYLLLCLLFIGIDTIYLTNASKFFNKQINMIQGSNISLNPISTALCYLILTTGIYYFALLKNLEIWECFLLGVFVYGVYETTNHAILKKWQWMTVLLDTVWGGILFSSVVYLHRKIRKLI